jgi:hypothetical protein
MGDKKGYIFQTIGAFFVIGQYFREIYFEETLDAALCNSKGENKRPLRTVLSFSLYPFCIRVHYIGLS